MLIACNMDDRANRTASLLAYTVRVTISVVVLEQRLSLATLTTADCAIKADDTAKCTGSILIIPRKDYCTYPIT